MFELKQAPVVMVDGFGSPIDGAPGWGFVGFALLLRPL
jgi:hypothetical protein